MVIRALTRRERSLQTISCGCACLRAILSSQRLRRALLPNVPHDAMGSRKELLLPPKASMALSSRSASHGYVCQSSKYNIALYEAPCYRYSTTFGGPRSFEMPSQLQPVPPTLAKFRDIVQADTHETVHSARPPRNAEPGPHQFPISSVLSSLAYRESD